MCSSDLGNFVEVKNSTLAPGVKVNHLSYIGDADLGAGVNVGAGTITANYDGVNKHRTVVGAGSKTGANSVLVAPITLGDNVTVGAGSTLTRDVPSGALALGRAKQLVKDSGVKTPIDITLANFSDAPSPQVSAAPGNTAGSVSSQSLASATSPLSPQDSVADAGSP